MDKPLRFKLLLCLLLCSTATFAQTMYHDAIQLKFFYEEQVRLDGNRVSKEDIIKRRIEFDIEEREEENLKNKEERDKIILLLLKYVHDSVTNDRELERNFSTNPFISIKENGSVSESNANLLAAATTPKMITGAAGLLSGIGGLDVTTIADGMAKFIVKRTKQELSIAFFDDFKKALVSNMGLRTFFPNTLIILNTTDQQVYNYENYINSLRSAFLIDLNSLDQNLPRLIHNNPKLFQKYPEVALMLKSGCYIADAMKKGEHPGEVIANYPISYLNPGDMSDNMRDVTGAVQLVQLLNESLRDTGAVYWVNRQQVELLVNDRMLLRIYLGLMMQKAKNNYGNVNFANKNFVELMRGMDIAGTYEHYTAVKQYLLSFSGNIGELDAKLNKAKGAGTDSLKIAMAAGLINSLIDLLENGGNPELMALVRRDQNFKDVAQRTQAYFSIARNVTALSTDINKKKYTEAVNRLVIIYNDAVVAHLGEEDTVRRNASRFMKYSVFMSSVVEAKDPDEVAGIVEAMALPPASARIKRTSNRSIALNAYCGLFIGNEFIKGVKNEHVVNSYGLTAPIGISFSNGRQHLPPFSSEKKYKGKWSHTLFISAVDIGAITAFRFNSENDSVKRIPSVQLSDIISPGVFYSMGIPSTPISLNIGYQAGPLLRKVTQAANTYSDNYNRFSVSICVDLPLLNFYTRPRL